MLEVMIAMSILAITLVTLLGSQSTSLSLTAEAKFNTIAQLLALEKLAELESGVTALESNDGTFEDDFDNYTWKIEVETLDSPLPKALDQLEEPLLKVEVTVSQESTPFKYQLQYYALHNR